ncbi:arginyl-tRNA synthetase [Arthrobacter sp. B3I9]|nr:arginyl-tRNA synthetase [Arthrobacter sp. B3I9]
MTPEELSLAISACLKDAVDAGEIGLTASDVPAEVRVERPKNRDHGDWATNIALQLAKAAGTNPREFASVLSARLKSIDGVSAVDIAGPGFLNITVDAATAGALAKAIVEAGRAYGTNAALAGHTVNMEFVSANPTGPLHIGHTRWAALGDSIARVLRASGADVTAEYYVNDAGSQMNVFAQSVLARMHGRELPEGGYPGEYIAELGHEVLTQHPDIRELTDVAALPVIRGCGLQGAAARHQADPRRVRRRLRRVLLRTGTPRRRGHRGRGRAAPRTGPRVRRRRGGLAAHHRLW